MEINTSLLDNLLEQAAASLRQRMNMDLRTTPEDSSQRILNALLPGTVMPIHRHRTTSETVVVLRGKMEEIFYEEGGRETSRVMLEAGGNVQGLCIPVGQWHTVNVLEPTVILECKDGKYEPLSQEDMISL